MLQNPYDPQADRSVSGFDLTNIFSASANYELPIGKGQTFNLENPIVNSLLGGWSLNSIVTLTSGSPYSVTVNGDIANVGNTFVQANLVGNPTPSHQTPEEWINPSAFAAPPRYTFGTFGRNALRTDPYKDLDFSIFKSFALPRGTSVQFRAESFNTLNQVIFSGAGQHRGRPDLRLRLVDREHPPQLQFALKVQF